MTTNGSPQVTTKTRMSSLLDLLTTLFRLVPKQLTDNLSLMSTQLKTKGIRADTGIGIAVIGFLFVTITFITRVLDLIGAFIAVAPLRQTGLWVALAAFVLMLVLLVVIAIVVRTVFTLVPQEIIRGVTHDVFYVPKGNTFDPVEF